MKMESSDGQPQATQNGSTGPDVPPNAVVVTTPEPAATPEPIDTPVIPDSGPAATAVPTPQEEQGKGPNVSLMEKYGQNFWKSYVDSKTVGSGELEGIRDLPYSEQLNTLVNETGSTSVKYVEYVDKDGKVEWRYVLYGKRDRNGKPVDDPNAIRVVKMGKDGWEEEFEYAETASSQPLEMSKGLKAQLELYEAYVRNGGKPVELGGEELPSLYERQTKERVDRLLENLDRDGQERNMMNVIRQIHGGRELEETMEAFLDRKTKISPERRRDLENRSSQELLNLRTVDFLINPPNGVMVEGLPEELKGKLNEFIAVQRHAVHLGGELFTADLGKRRVELTKELVKLGDRRDRLYSELLRQDKLLSQIKVTYAEPDKWKIEERISGRAVSSDAAEPTEGVPLTPAEEVKLRQGFAKENWNGMFGENGDVTKKLEEGESVYVELTNPWIGELTKRTLGEEGEPIVHPDGTQVKVFRAEVSMLLEKDKKPGEVSLAFNATAKRERKFLGIKVGGLEHGMNGQMTLVNSLDDKGRPKGVVLVPNVSEDPNVQRIVTNPPNLLGKDMGSFLYSSLGEDGLNERYVRQLQKDLGDKAEDIKLTIVTDSATGETRLRIDFVAKPKETEAPVAAVPVPGTDAPIPVISESDEATDSKEPALEIDSLINKDSEHVVVSFTNENGKEFYKLYAWDGANVFSVFVDTNGSSEGDVDFFPVSNREEANRMIKAQKQNFVTFCENMNFHYRLGLRFDKDKNGKPVLKGPEETEAGAVEPAEKKKLSELTPEKFEEALGNGKSDFEDAIESYRQTQSEADGKILTDTSVGYFKLLQEANARLTATIDEEEAASGAADAFGLYRQTVADLEKAAEEVREASTPDQKAEAVGIYSNLLLVKTRRVGKVKDDLENAGAAAEADETAPNAVPETDVAGQMQEETLPYVEPELTDKQLNTSIDDLGLSAKVSGLLKGEGIATVGKVIKFLEKGDETAISIKGLGEKSVEELRQKMQEKGYLPTVTEKQTEVAAKVFDGGEWGRRRSR